MRDMIAQDLVPPPLSPHDEDLETATLQLEDAAERIRSGLLTRNTDTIVLGALYAAQALRRLVGVAHGHDGACVFRSGPLSPLRLAGALGERLSAND